VGWRNGPARQCVNDGKGVPVAGEGGDGVQQLEEETGNEGRLTPEGDDGQGWELTEGGSRQWLHFQRHRRASGGRPWTGGNGGDEVVLVVCLRRRKRVGNTKGRAASAMPFINAAGGREGEGGSKAVSVWKRETGGESGGPSAVANGHR
jgi:hypothetical protein